MSPGPPDWLEIQGDRLLNLDLEGFSGLRVLVAGDFMLDEYLWGKVERISPEAPVAVVEVERETRTLGAPATWSTTWWPWGPRWRSWAWWATTTPAACCERR